MPRNSNLIPNVRTITRGNTTFQQTYWTKPLPIITTPNLVVSERDLITGALRKHLVGAPSITQGRRKRKHVAEQVGERMTDIENQGFLQSCKGFSNYPSVWKKAGESFITEVGDMLEINDLPLGDSPNAGILSSTLITSSGWFGVRENFSNPNHVDINVVLDGHQNDVIYESSGDDTEVEPTSRSKEYLTERLSETFFDSGFNVIHSGVSGWGDEDDGDVFCVITVERW